jgi:hypothetical protein
MVKQGKQICMQGCLQGVVRQVGAGGKAEGDAAGVQVAQQALCGSKDCTAWWEDG